MCPRGLAASIGLVAFATLLPAQDPSAGGDAAKRHWAFQPLARVQQTVLKNRDRVRTSIDKFILAKLEAQSLSFAADADQVTLVRRASRFARFAANSRGAG